LPDHIIAGTYSVDRAELCRQSGNLPAGGEFRAGVDTNGNQQQICQYEKQAMKAKTPAAVTFGKLFSTDSHFSRSRFAFAACNM
jgi:hypothetical protein